MKTTIKRVFVSLVVACLMVFANVIIAQAGGPYYISEAPLTWLSGSGTPTSVSTSSCYSGTCKYMYQDTGNPATRRWARTYANIYQWYVYRPDAGEAAARYWWITYRNGVKDSWYVNVNQAVSKGTWAYLGYSDYLPNNYGELRLSNQCVSGYWCGGLRVYWDEMRYLTSP
ncbi:MAG: hypothetical protein L6461_08305 [Anaerolineae bacterium]|nr:hypothetical protein [Anaerolineae bacterium]